MQNKSAIGPELPPGCGHARNVDKKEPAVKLNFPADFSAGELKKRARGGACDYCRMTRVLYPRLNLFASGGI
jgi:hypothetical protein